MTENPPWIIIVPPDMSTNDVPPAVTNLLPGDCGVLILPHEVWTKQQSRLEEALKLYESSLLSIEDVKRRGWFRR